MSLTKFNAAAARELSGPTIEEQVDQALIQIKDAASKKYRQTNLVSNLWVNGGYSKTEDYKKACKMLTDLGFTVEFFYEERQFVSMFTVVKW